MPPQERIKLVQQSVEEMKAKVAQDDYRFHYHPTAPV